MNAAGMIAKYLATSLAMLNVVRAPRVISSCLPISTTSISLVGLESRSTMLPASLAAWVPEFMATATSAWARAGESLVPSPVRRQPAHGRGHDRRGRLRLVPWSGDERKRVAHRGRVTIEEPARGHVLQTRDAHRR